MGLHEELTQYGLERLGPHATSDSPDVADLFEALERQVFKHGKRTNPGGYYLDVMTEGLKDAEGRILIPAALKSANEMLRLNLDKEYKGYRNDFYTILNDAIPKHLRPRAPLKHVRLMVQIFTNRPENKLLDVEAKYSAIKPLLDCLQPNTVFSGSGREVTRRGVGVIEDDTDGEHFRRGVVKQLEVMQIKTAGKPRVRIVIEEIKEWKL